MIKEYYDDGNANGEIPKQISLFCGIIVDMEKLRNIAFIDAQNLTQNMRNTKNPWKLDLVKFRVFLKDRFQCDKVYMVSCLIKDRKFCSIMFPSKNSSRLYRKIDPKFITKLYVIENRRRLELKK